MQEKPTETTAGQAPKTTKEVLASVKTMSDAKAVIKELYDTVKEQSDKIGQLEARVAWLLRQWLGQKSEKQPAYDPNWPDLFQGQFDDLLSKAQEESAEAEKQIPEDPKEDRKRRRENRKMMEDLPVLDEQHYYPEGIDLSLYKEIGTEVPYTAECEPGKLYRKAHIRHKYGLKDSCTLPPSGQPAMVIAPMPALPIYKGIPGPTLLTELLLNKYEYHLPFYRQVKMLGTWASM